MANVFMARVAREYSNCQASPAIAGFFHVMGIVTDHRNFRRTNTHGASESADHVTRWLGSLHGICSNNLIKKLKNAEMVQVVAGGIMAVIGGKAHMKFHLL